MGGEIDATDAVVAGVRDVEAGGVEGEAGGRGELGADGRAAIAPCTKDTGAGEGRDDAGGAVDDADAVVVGVCDEEVAGGVEGESVGASSSAAAAGLPSPENPWTPVPAMVVRVPEGLRRRTVWLAASAMRRLPAAS